MRLFVSAALLVGCYGLLMERRTERIGFEMRFRVLAHGADLEHGEAVSAVPFALLHEKRVSPIDH